MDANYWKEDLITHSGVGDDLSSVVLESLGVDLLEGDSNTSDGLDDTE